jgi:hypothetical protein
MITAPHFVDDDTIWLAGFGDQLHDLHELGIDGLPDALNGFNAARRQQTLEALYAQSITGAEAFKPVRHLLGLPLDLAQGSRPPSGLRIRWQIRSWRGIRKRLSAPAPKPAARVGVRSLRRELINRLRRLRCIMLHRRFIWRRGVTPPLSQRVHRLRHQKTALPFSTGEGVV